MRAQAVDFRDVQGLVRFGYRRLTEASFLLLNIRDANAARAWLRSAPISDAVACDTAPLTALQVAFTRQGLERLGVPPGVLASFSLEFRAGMSEDAGRSRLLGDIGANAPEHWQWGGPKHVPHVLVLLYAQPGHLHAWTETVKDADWDNAFELIACLPTSDLGGFEPFGFTDGVSQPSLDWEGQNPPPNHLPTAPSGEQLTYTNLVSLGEFLLGYPNEYGRYTDRPLLGPDGPDDSLSAGLPTAHLPAAEDRPELRDLGRNGCYLVLRTLAQDVRRFWQFANANAGADTQSREALATAMVGRRRDGTPLVPLSSSAIPGVEAEDAAQNQFTFDADPEGTQCPFGAHIRRANPRNADLPTPPVHGIQKALRVVGLGQKDLRSDAKASTRFHRILRRGREFGSALSVHDALSGAPDSAAVPDADTDPHGIHFICLVANISRQFEFLQSAWLMSSKFDAMTDESDPLLGNRLPVSGAITDVFSRSREGGLRERLCGLPQFVTVKGGAYFFLPSLPAIRYISTLGGPA